MTHNITKRTFAGMLALLCAAGAVPSGRNLKGFDGINAITAYADNETDNDIVIVDMPELGDPIYTTSVYDASNLDEFLSAVKKVNDGDTIMLTDSFTISSKVTINNGKTFTVDFNGNTIYLDGTGNGKIQNYLYIDNNDCHVTFLDRSHGGGITAVNKNIVRLIMISRGTVELLSGTYISGYDITRTNTVSAYVYVRGGYYDLLNDDRDGPFYRNGSGNYYLLGGYYTENSRLRNLKFKLDNDHEYYETGDEKYITGIRRIGAEAIDKADIADIPERQYTRRIIRPKHEINFGTRGLKENVDYTVSYENNINVGTATMHINGIGDFYGTVTKTFCIKERPAYKIPDDVNAPFGSTLANVKLPAADNGTWSWEDSSLSVGDIGTKNFKAIFTPKDTEHYLTIKGISVPVTVHHTYTKVAAVEPTCTKKGNIEYYICSDGKYYTDDKGTKEITLSATVVKAKGHSFVEPTWNWSKDYSRATMSSTCAECGKVSSSNALIRTETIDPTYTSEGKTIYKATVTFNNKTYNDTKELTIPKLVYTAPEISYEQGYNAVKLSWDKVSSAEKYGIAGYVNGKWKLLDTCTDNTYELRNLKEGKKYKVAVVTMLSGNWVQDVSNAVIVAPKDIETRFPSVTSIEYNEEYHQFRLNWTKVKGAQNYGVAVFASGKWVVVKQDIPTGTTSFTSPKLRPGQTYKMVICAKVSGKWDTVDISSRAFSVTVK